MHETSVCAKNDAMLKKCKSCRLRFYELLVLVPIINRNRSSKAQKDMEANIKETQLRLTTSACQLGVT